MTKIIKKLCLMLSVFMVFTTVQTSGNKVFGYTGVVQERLMNAVVLYLENPKAFVNNTEVKIDPINPYVVPVTRNQRTLVPVRFIAENFGGKVDWDNKTSTVTINLDKKIVKLTLGSNRMYVNDKEVTLDVPAQSIGDRIYIPLRRLAEDALGKKVFFDRGLIVISDIENIFAPTSEKEWIDEIIDLFTSDVKVKSSRDYINISVGGGPYTMDPAKSVSIEEGTYILHAFEGLTRMGKDGSIQPGIAEKWEVSPDGTVYTFYLSGSRWSDGVPVKAQDFEYAWKRALNPETASEYAFMLYDIKNAEAYNSSSLQESPSTDAVGIKALDDKTLRVELKAPASHWITMISHPIYMPVRKDIIERYGDRWYAKAQSFISNGAYTMTYWEANSKMVFEKNPFYWDNERTIVNRINWILMEDGNDAVNAYNFNEVDGVYSSISADLAAQLKKNEDFQIYDGIGTYYLLFNTTKAPMNDPRVRKALALAIDRKFITEEVMKLGQKPALGLIPCGLWAEKDFRTEAKDSGILAPTAKIQEAKILFAEAGYADGKGFPEIEMIYDTNNGHKAIMEAVQQQWKDNLSITVKIRNMEFEQLMDSSHSGNYMIARSGWIAEYNDPMSMLELWTTGNSLNETGWSNLRYDELIRAVKHSMNKVTRIRAMHEAEDILINEMPVCPIYSFVRGVLQSPNLKGVQVSPTGYVYFHNAYVE